MERKEKKERPTWNLVGREAVWLGPTSLVEDREEERDITDLGILPEE